MLNYIIQTIAFQIFFLIIYDVFLKKETFFNWNRVYLLLTALLSLVLPFIKIDQFKNVIPQEYIISLPEVIIGEISNQPIIANNIVNIGSETGELNIWQAIFYLGMVISALLLLYKLSKIFLLIFKNPKFKKGKLYIVNILNSRDAFSFLNYVFLGEKIKPEEKASILIHERVHVTHKHTLDLLYFETLRIVFWFNPLVYMYQNRISALHEFIADAKASKQLDTSQYYQNLLSQVFDTNRVSFINSFYKKSLIKKRIIMLSKSKSRQYQLLKYVLLIPLVLSMLIYTSTNAQDLKTSNLSDEELKEKFYNELIDLDIDNKSFYEIWSQYNPDPDAYILSRENYYKSGAYLKILVDKMINSKKNKGEYTEEDDKRYKELFSKTDRSYAEYLEYKKTDEAKEIWESQSRDGILRMFYDGSIKSKENKDRYEKNLEMIKKSDYYHSLLMTNGKMTAKLTINKELADKQESEHNSISNNELEVPFAVIDEVPVYSGCEVFEENADRRNCMAEKISLHVQKQFNTKIGKEVGLKGKQRVNVFFKIDKQGNVIGIRARAPHPKLEEEAIRVIKLLPQFKPGKQKGEAVIVPYSLPIVFEVKK